MYTQIIRFTLVICCILYSTITMAQQYSLSELFATPYLSQLHSGGNTGDLVFSVNDRGHRNVYIARYPDYEPQNLTQWDEDLGLEITSLSVSSDGQWATFVRGGEHGGNSATQAVNPASLTERQQILLYTIHLPSGQVQLIGEGGQPVIHPDSKRLSFRKNSQVWIVPLDNSSKPKQLFHVASGVRSMQWSPDGKQLLFDSNRRAYSFIGIFSEDQERIRWVAPSYHRDSSPRWSPDGQSVTFIRNLASGGVVDSPVPATIMTVDLRTDTVKELWQASDTPQGDTPRWPGGYNLQWLMDDAITFLSYEDGWPHLYKVNTQSGQVQQLTQGDFTVEQISYSADGSKILLAANTGELPDDIDRKHIAMVDVASVTFDVLTKGEGIETHPIFVRGTDEIAFFSNTVHRPTLPTVMKVNEPDSQKIIASSLLPDFDYQQLVTPEHISFQAEDGHPVYGQVFKPKHMTKDAPALVYIHGGPRRQMLLGWHFGDYYFYDYMLNQYLASQGYVVLSVNYRLGIGYGYDFQHAKEAGRSGASEYLDVRAAGEWLAKQSFVDKDRIGLYGGSYGGFLTAMGLGKDSDLFKVGVDIHGVHEWLRGASATASKADSIAWESSPSKWVDTWKSPVLIIHGDDDYNVGFGQSIDLANRLIGKDVEVEYLVLPDENHHWMLYQNLIKVKEATADFIKRKLPVHRKDTEQ